MDNIPLILEDGTKIQQLQKDYRLYFRKTTLVFGAPKTGKSKVVTEIMYLCKDFIPNVFVISPTNQVNNTFSNIVPANCIKATMTMEWLDGLIRRQMDAAVLYSNANNIKILEALFERVATPQQKKERDEIVATTAGFVKAIDEITNILAAEKRIQKKNIQEKNDDTLIALYRSIVQMNAKKLLAMPGLTSNEYCAVKSVDFLPDTMLIFDDCASHFKRWTKSSTSFKDIFYNVRWRYLTVIVTTQDDKEIDSELRKACMISYFTSPQVACANFERAANNFTKSDKEMARKTIKEIFRQEKGKHINRKKLIYVRGEPDPFRYSVADEYEDFRFGCAGLWELDKKINNTTSVDSEREICDRYKQLL